MIQELLIEILTEEIPAHMQHRASQDMTSFFKRKFEDLKVNFEKVSSYVTPRRLILVVNNLDPIQPDRYEEKKGPKVGAPEKAIQGFLKSVGLHDLSKCSQIETKKGIFWSTTLHIKGHSIQKIIPDLMQEFISSYTWPKSMRWGENSQTWIRPIQQILCLYNKRGINGSITLESDVIYFCTKTKGHRFHSPNEISVDSFQDYQKKLYDAHVIVDQNQRRDLIKIQAQKLAEEKGLKLRQDQKLLEEVTGLVEWPVVLLGQIDPDFLSIPEEVLITAMRVHQRYFALENTQGQLAPFFLVVANISAMDQGSALVKGNERVLQARLADARFFYEQDRKHSLSTHAQNLSEDIFFDQLGTMADKKERLIALASFIAQQAETSTFEAQRAAELCKADLCTGMVKEFPELQGIMGYYYSQHDGETQNISQAIADHYLPKGSEGSLPRSDIGKVVSLTDKIDSLVGFFSIGIQPTSSKDPYALRRAALGAIRLLEAPLNLTLREVISKSYDQYTFSQARDKVLAKDDLIKNLETFFLERLKIYWRDQGLRHDHISAIINFRGLHLPLSLLYHRIKSLQDFIEQKDGIATSLLSAYRRACNIVNIEEKKDKAVYGVDINVNLLENSSEKNLYNQLNASSEEIKSNLNAQNFEQALTCIANLKPFIDAFFDQVTVNTENSARRINRLKLLSLMRETLHQVADFSKIEGS